MHSQTSMVKNRWALEWISNFIPHFTGHVTTYPWWFAAISNEISPADLNDKYKIFFIWCRRNVGHSNAYKS